MSKDKKRRMIAAGREVARLRQSHQPPLSQTDLGNAIGSSGAFINLIEHGNRGFSLKTAQLIASALGLTPAVERAFMAIAGFPAPQAREALESVINVVMADDPENLILAEFVRTDLLLNVHAWRRLVQAQLDLRTGSVDECRGQFERLATERALSPMIRLYAKRKLGEAARLARDLPDADVWLRDALGSEDLTALLLASPYHGELLRAVLYGQQGDAALQLGDYRKALELFRECEHRYRALPGTPFDDGPAGDAKARDDASAQESPSDQPSLSGPFPLLAPSHEDARVIWYQGLGMTSQRIAEALMFLERTDDALESCKKAERYLENIGDTPQKQQTLRRVSELRAWALARAHKYAEASAQHRVAIENARKARDVDAEMMNRLYLGEDQLHQIEDVIEAIAQRAYTKEDPPGILSPREAWAEALRIEPGRAEWLVEAERAFQEVREFQVRSDRAKRPTAHSVSNCQRGLAGVARLNQKYREATDYLQRAESREHARYSVRRLRFIFEERANLYWDQEFLDLARREYTFALEQVAKDLVNLRANQPDEPNAQAGVGSVLEAHRDRLKRKITRLEAASRTEARLTGRAAGAPVARPDDVSARPRPSPVNAHDALNQLYDLALQVIRDSGRVPTAPDVESEAWLDVWLQELKDFEGQRGARFLAQNEFSLALASELPEHMRQVGGSASQIALRNQLFELRRAAFLAGVEEAHNQRMEGQSNFDVCSQPWIRDYATSEEIHQRASEAFKIALKHPHGYAVAAAPFGLPFGFCVKGAYTLIEAPESFLREAGLPIPTADGTSDSDSQRERRAGYRFIDQDIADEFRRHFMALYQGALREFDTNATMRWLGDIAERGGRKRSTGL